MAVGKELLNQVMTPLLRQWLMGQLSLESVLQKAQEQGFAPADTLLFLQSPDVVLPTNLKTQLDNVIAGMPSNPTLVTKVGGVDTSSPPKPPATSTNPVPPVLGGGKPPTANLPVGGVVTPPAGVGGVGGVGGTGDTGFDPYENIDDPRKQAYARYANAFKIPYDRATPGQSWQARQFAPTYSLWQANQLLDPEAYNETDFGRYSTMAPVGAAGRKAAGEAFGKFADMTPEQWAASSWGAEDNPLGSDEDEDQLIYGALSSRYGRPIAERFLKQAQGMRSAYQMKNLETQDYTPTGNLYDEIRKRFRLQ